MLRAVTLITVNLLDFFNASRSSKKCCDTLEQSKFEIYTVISKSIKHYSPIINRDQEFVRCNHIIYL